MDGGIFRPIFVPDGFREAVSGRAWLQAMLDAEAALATAEAQVGLIPHEAADGHRLVLRGYPLRSRGARTRRDERRATPSHRS